MATDLAFGTGATGASRTYTPAARKADGTTAAYSDMPIIEIGGATLGTPQDAATPDTTVGGAPFSVMSLLKGAVTNLLAISNKLAAGLSVTTTPGGLGSLTPVVTPSANGAPLGTPPTGKRGARLYVLPGASVTFTIASQQPGAPPTATITIGNPSTNSLPANWDEDLAGTQQIYVTGSTGTSYFRWY